MIEILSYFNYNHLCFMADVAQLVRAPVCGTGGRGFKPHHSPQDKAPAKAGVLSWRRGGLNTRPRPWVRPASGGSQDNLLLKAMLSEMKLWGRRR